MASSSNANANNEMDQLVELQRAGLLSVSDFLRMSHEIKKSDTERLAEARGENDEEEVASAPSSPPSSPPTLEKRTRSSDDEELLVDEDGTDLRHARPLSEEEEGSFDDEHDEDMREEEQRPEEQSAHAEEFQEGMVMLLNGEREVTIVRVGGSIDFINANRIYVRYEQVKKNCKRKMETAYRWVNRVELSKRMEPEMLGQSPLAVRSPTIRAMSFSDETARSQQRGEQSQAQGDTLPQLAAHERERKLPQKVEAQQRRQMGEYKTAESKVPLVKRLEQFKEHTLVITHGPDGHKLFCRACKHTLRNNWSTIDDHCKRHRDQVLKYHSRVDDDAELKGDILAYYDAHPDQQQGSMDPDEAVFRYRVTETFLASGTPLSVCDQFRPLLQRIGFALTNHTHLKAFIPQIEQKQITIIKQELEGQYVSIVFDGTTRLGEAVNVVGRWCTSDFRLTHRLLDFTTFFKHLDAAGLAVYVNDLLGRERGVPAMKLVGFSRDSCSTNGAACRRLMVNYTSAVDMLCICHTLCHVGEHFELPTLDAFMTPWLELVGGRNPHAGAKMLWKETVAPATVPGYSHIRWYSKAEIIFVIGEVGTQRLRDFLGELQQRDYGGVTRTKMQHIYDTQADRLRLEIAGMLDMRKLVSTTYELEGDRLEILLTYDRIEALRTMGNSLRTRADGILPNVDAVVRRLMELKPGVKMEKYFHGTGVCVGTLKKKEIVQSTLYPGQDREAWVVDYADGHTDDFEEEELRSGRDGPAPANTDGKPVLVVRHLQMRNDIYDALVPGFDYLESRITGTCDAQYSCVAMYEVARVARALNPNFAAGHLSPAFIDAMVAITPLASHGLLQQLKTELPLYLAAAQNAPPFDPSDVEGFTVGILGWWRTNGKSFPTWAEAARITFSLSPNSAACERVFSLLKNMFGEQQLEALADYIRAALMLAYNKRTVG